MGDTDSALLHTFGADNLTGSSTNASIDTLLPHQPENNSFSIVIKIELVCLPVICILGLVGNTLSTITFLRKPLRKYPCSLFLAVRGISDNGFLFSLLLIWISSTFDLRLSRVKGVCQLIIFMTYLCGCVSVWLCVFITFENAMLIYKPFFAKRVCTDKTSRTCIITLVAVAVAFYNTSLWIMNGDCSHNPQHSALTQVLVYADTFVTLVIPTMLITILLCIISYKVIHLLHNKRLQSVDNDSATKYYCKTKLTSPITKVTKMLFIVSLTFFILNGPSHVIRLIILIGSFTKGETQPPQIEATIQYIMQLVYYLSFSVNIVVYLAFGGNFRKLFVRTFLGCGKAHVDDNHPREAVNLVRRRRHSVTAPATPDTNRNFLRVETPQRCHSH